MSRSFWKPNYSYPFFSFLKKKILKEKNFKRKIFNRSAQIPLLSKFYIRVHNGRKFNLIKVNKILVNKKIGELVLTKKPFFYPKKKNKKR